MAAVHVRHDRDAVLLDAEAFVAMQAVGPVQAGVDYGAARVVAEAEGRIVLAGDRERQPVQPVLPLHLERLVAAHLERAPRPGVEIVVAVAPYRGRDRRYAVRAYEAGLLDRLADRHFDLAFAGVVDETRIQCVRNGVHKFRLRCRVTQAWALCRGERISWP